MLTALFVTVLFIVISAFYVAAEFGAVSVRRGVIRQLADEGNALALRLHPVLQDPVRLDWYIAACQIGITWTSLVLGAYSQTYITPGIAPFVQETTGLGASASAAWTATGVLLCLTVFQVVVGELIPKSIALQYPTQAALYTLPGMKLSVTLYWWFLKIMNGSGLAILKLFGFSKVGHGHVHSPEEIELLIAESRKGGLLEPEEHERLQRGLRLVSRPVRQLMVPRRHVVSVNADSSPEALAGLMRSSPFTRLPVHEGMPDNIIGLLHTKDAVAFVAEHGRVPSPREILRPLATIPETVSAGRLFSLFRERRTHQALVVDEYSVVGLVTLGDIVSELLGDAPSALWHGQPRPIRLPDGRVRLPGLMRLDEASVWIGVPLNGPADTLAGHVMHLFGRVPEVNEGLEIDGALVVVERRNGNTIVSLLVTSVPAAAEGVPHG